jgi:IS30 family transposase
MKNKLYIQLSCEERDSIAILRAKGISITQIAKTINRDKSTVSRELKRNGSPMVGFYLPHKAQERAIKRKRAAGRRPRLKDAIIRNYVVKHIKLGWSPEQIAGRFSIKYPASSISHEAIYQFVYDKAGRLLNLKQYLPRAHRIRQRRGFSRKHRKSHIPERILIDRRPKHIQTRKQLGHWEVDSIASRRSQLAAVAIALERKSRIVHLAKLRRKTSLCFSNALIRCLSCYPRQLRRTITYDNGPENVYHQRTNTRIGSQSFFCQPYQSWQKGSVEQAVGLVRRYLPKKKDLGTITNERLKQIESLLNNRPRKCLRYKTPYEVLHKSVALAR